MNFSEVQKNSPGLEQFFSKVLKRLRRSCKVLQGSEVPFGSIRLDNDPQDSTKFEMDLSGSSRFCEALKVPKCSLLSSNLLQGPLKFDEIRRDFLTF